MTKILKQFLGASHFSKFDFSMAGAAKRNKILQLIRLFPIAVKLSIGFNMMYAQIPSSCSFLLSANCAFISIPFHGGSLLHSPIWPSKFNRSPSIVDVFWAALINARSLIPAFYRTAMTFSPIIVLRFMNDVTFSANFASQCDCLGKRLSWLWLTRSEFRPALGRTKSARSAIPCFKSIFAPFAFADFSLVFWNTRSVFKSAFWSAIFFLASLPFCERKAATGADDYLAERIGMAFMRTKHLIRMFGAIKREIAGGAYLLNHLGILTHTSLQIRRDQHSVSSMLSGATLDHKQIVPSIRELRKVTEPATGRF